MSNFYLEDFLLTTIPSVYVNKRLLPKETSTQTDKIAEFDDSYQDSEPLQFELYAEKIECGYDKMNVYTYGEHDTYCSTPDSDSDLEDKLSPGQENLSPEPNWNNGFHNSAVGGRVDERSQEQTENKIGFWDFPCLTKKQAKENNDAHTEKSFWDFPCLTKKHTTNENETYSKFKNYDIFNNNSNLIDFINGNIINGNGNNDLNISDIPSYANIARVPKFVEVKMGKRVVQIKYEYYHMMERYRTGDKFHCMICNLIEEVKFAYKHCNSDEHKRKLDRCRRIESYGDYFIRNVDYKYYHCAHCNSLQLKNEIVIHIQSRHPKTSTEVSPRNNDHDKKEMNENNRNDRNTNTSNERNIESNDKKQTNVNNMRSDRNINTIKDKTKENTNTNDRNTNNDKANENNDNKQTNVNIRTDRNANTINDANINSVNINNDSAFGYLVINPFGMPMKISFLSYFVAWKKSNGYYCGLCDFNCSKESVISHVFKHGTYLQSVPFIKEFSWDLLRAIYPQYNQLHCAICNFVLTPPQVLEHLNSIQHKKLRHSAVNFIPPTDSPIGEFPLKLPITGAIKIPSNPVIFKVPKLIDFSYTPPLPENPEQENLVGNRDNGNKIDENRNNGNKIEGNRNNGSENETDENENINNESEYETDQNENNESTDNEEIEINESFESVDSDDATFDMEEYVYLKLNNTYIKVSNTAFNTLVHTGMGGRYCFVCDELVSFCELQKHIDSKTHNEKMKYRFVMEYESHLFRQLYLDYHCCICNVIVTRRDLQDHIQWLTHTMQKKNIIENIKKTRKNDIKSGAKVITVSTQKENIFLKDKEPAVKILHNSQKQELIGNTGESVAMNAVKTTDFTKKNKIVLFSDKAFCLSWNNWHSIMKTKNGFRCILCKQDLKVSDVNEHCKSDGHNYALDTPVEKKLAPLIRKVNNTTMNCLICNTEVSSKPQSFNEHIKGKGHVNNFKTIYENSKSGYSDCDPDVYIVAN